MSLKEKKTGIASKKDRTERSPDEMRETWYSKFFGLKLVLLIHIFVYSAINGLCYMLNLMIWHGQLWAWHVTAGWGIGIVVHLTIYYLITSGVKSISKCIFTTHLAVYLVTSVYLILINFVYMWKLPGVLWAHIPILLWGFGVLLNLLTNTMIEGQGLKSEEIGRIVGKILLLANVCYYVIVNTMLLFMGLFNTIYHLASGIIFGWGLALCAHAAITFVALFIDTTGAKKGWLIHTIIFGVANLANLIDIIFFSVGETNFFISYTTRINIFLISIGIWTIILLAHLVLVLRWDQTGGDVTDFMKNLFIMHLIAYVAGVGFMILINMMRWEGRMWFITAALGWAVGVVVHYLIYNFIKEKEKDSLKVSILLHIAAYIVVQGLLIWINLAFWQGRFWVPTVSIGWGIGLSMHILTYILFQNDLLVPEKGLKVSVYYHGTGYAMVNALFVWLNLAIWEGRLWFPIVLIAWGIGLGAHIIIWSQLKKEHPPKS
ncbi:MAG: 2TM domain-containing protein [Candidatus Helarchaeota archaeon]